MAGQCTAVELYRAVDINREREKHTGRPTDYKPEYCETILAYFEVCEYMVRVNAPDPTYDPNVPSAHQRVRTIYADFPTIDGFCTHIGVSKNTLYRWAKLYPDFSDAISKCKSRASHLLMNQALKGRWSQSASLWVGINALGWSSKERPEPEAIDTVAEEIDARLSSASPEALEKIRQAAALLQGTGMKITIG
jgi:hypothetical protein